MNVGTFLKSTFCGTKLHKHSPRVSSCAYGNKTRYFKANWDLFFTLTKRFFCDWCYKFKNVKIYTYQAVMYVYCLPYIFYLFIFYFYYLSVLISVFIQWLIHQPQRHFIESTDLLSLKIISNLKISTRLQVLWCVNLFFHLTLTAQDYGWWSRHWSVNACAWI